MDRPQKLEWITNDTQKIALMFIKKVKQYNTYNLYIHFFFNELREYQLIILVASGEDERVMGLRVEDR